MENNKEFKNEHINETELKINIWRLFSYFIIYSIIGFLVETLFGLAKYGTLESRKSFLYGPFCAIYGVGAFVMIPSLTYFKKNHFTLFLGGCLVGSVIEYAVSFIGEAILHVKWWDYQDMPLNINGRICLLYSVFWGALGLVLMISINPRIDKIINYIKQKTSHRFLKHAVAFLTIFMLFDCIVTGLALNCFTIRTIKEKNIEVSNQDYINKEYKKIYEKEIYSKLINKFFNNEKMIKTFPRITVQNVYGDIINVSELYPEVKTYYLKLK